MWYDDLVEYYGVTEQQAFELGQRKTGRRPNLPSSKTCQAVSGLNFEELWDLYPRDTLQKKMDFYKDIGAWQVFRQTNYRKDFNYGGLFGSFLKPDSTIVEYGCGVAPFTNYVVENADDIENMRFSLVDVAGEHLHFARWRLNKKAQNKDFDFHEITSEYPIPKFDRIFDIICIMDVFEHLPNPYDVVVNLTNHTKSGTVLVETWREGGVGGCDLQEAEDQRKMTMEYLGEHYRLLKSGSIRIHCKR